MRLRYQVVLFALPIACALALGASWCGRLADVEARIADLRSRGEVVDGPPPLTEEEIALQRALGDVRARLQRDLAPWELEDFFLGGTHSAEDAAEMFERADPALAELHALLETPEARRAVVRGRPLLHESLMDHGAWTNLLLARGRPTPRANPIACAVHALDMAVLAGDDRRVTFAPNWNWALLEVQRLAQEPRTDVERLWTLVRPRLVSREGSAWAHVQLARTADGRIDQEWLGRPRGIRAVPALYLALRSFEEFLPDVARAHEQIRSLSTDGLAGPESGVDDLRLSWTLKVADDVVAKSDLASLALRLAVRQRRTGAWPDEVDATGTALEGCLEYERDEHEVRLAVRSPRVARREDDRLLVWTLPVETPPERTVDE